MKRSCQDSNVGISAENDWDAFFFQKKKEEKKREKFVCTKFQIVYSIILNIVACNLQPLRMVD